MVEANFDLKLLDSSDDETIFITQMPRVVNSDEENVNDKSVSDLDLEGLLNTTNDSAIGSVASVKGSDNESEKEENLSKSPKIYCPVVEDISGSERWVLV